MRSLHYVLDDVRPVCKSGVFQCGIICDMIRFENSRAMTYWLIDNH